MYRRTSTTIVQVVMAISALIAPAGVSLRSVTEPTHRAWAAGEGIHQGAVRNPRTAAACGVARWSVKTGTDMTARSVNMRRIIPTTVAALTRLAAPRQLPEFGRVRPVETTLYQVNATLTGFKEQKGSDYRLILRDGGRTMIADIPSPLCIGAQSPFLLAILNARAAFDAHYRVEQHMRHVHTQMTVIGVGFFDVIRGRHGAARNGIALHPVLAVEFTGHRIAPRPSSRAVPEPSDTFVVRASVMPMAMPPGVHLTLRAKSIPGARCSASVVYSTGHPPLAFDGSPRIVGKSGTVSWSWHEEARVSGGTATVSCTYQGEARRATTSFRVPG